MKKFLLILLFASSGPRFLAGDDHNPIGVTGAFEGVITTGCAYNVLSHNATRQIDDIVVPGAIGKYGLKMTRYYNSRSTFGYGILGPGWTHEYLWTSSNDRVKYPNGSVWDSHCTGDWGLGGPLGVSAMAGAMSTPGVHTTERSCIQTERYSTAVVRGIGAYRTRWERPIGQRLGTAIPRFAWPTAAPSSLKIQSGASQPKLSIRMAK